MPDDPIVLLLKRDPDLSERYAAWLGDDYTVRVAESGEAARRQFDDAVDVVLLERDLPDTAGEDLLGRLKASGVECGFAMLTETEPDAELLRLDVDEYVTEPIERAELRALVDRLVERAAVEGAMEEYLSALSKKRALEADLDEEGRESDPRYRSLSSELLARRRQIESLLTGLDGSGIDAPNSDADDPTPEPIYKTHPLEFYGLWLLAALTYGVGDIVSTVYAVFAVSGVDEANPVVDTLLVNFGIGGFMLFKLIVFLALISISVQGARTTDRFSYYWPPAIATSLGAGLTLWNLSLIF